MSSDDESSPPPPHAVRSSAAVAVKVAAEMVRALRATVVPPGVRRCERERSYQGVVQGAWAVSGDCVGAVKG
ncbi:hypothetical protein GCM10010279_13610 [Streptomyces mutabilis]|nr:hypothetical protein GCM10010279_13610 [Streptomyces mutabilis]